MKKNVLLTTLVISSLIFAGCTQKKTDQNIKLTKNVELTQKQEPAQVQQKGTTMKTINDFEAIEATQVTMTTTKGEMTFNLFRDKAPLTTANFLNLIKDGFYDGIIFHRVIPDFMAQVGDPLTKEAGMEARWGTGGPGYQIADEFDPELKHDKTGVLSMANSGPNTGGSQLFITHVATPWLDGKHAVFGEITAGVEVLNQIEQGDKILSVSYK
jgi:cyclophilin family peptidyl-prolyl cis-trans isomerase